METTIKAEAMELQSQIVSWRREFHQCPELKMDTPITSGKIAEILKSFGIPNIQTGVGGNGVVAVIEGKMPGKCLGIRADCDGLPIREETGLPFASQNGNMHACGHDAHVAMALGAAKLLYAHRSELHGQVKMIFQPYEEGGGGAKAMIADGVLENPHVDNMIALHTGNAGDPTARSGQFCYHPVASAYCSNAFSLDVIGKGGHAAMPHKSVDPLLTSCYLVTQLQSLLSRETEPGEGVILGIQSLQSGSRHNVIPETAHMEGSLRAENTEICDAYEARIQKMSALVAESMRCRAVYKRLVRVPACTNDPRMTKSLLAAAGKILPESDIVQMRKIPTGGEDFAFFVERVPSVYFFLSASLGQGKDYPHHHPKFDIDETYLWRGAGIFAEFALSWQQE